MFADYEGVGWDIIDCSFHIHRHLGPGLLESAYKNLLAYTLGRRGHVVELERPLSLEFEGARFEASYRVDLLVDGCVVVELKAVEKLAPVHAKQALTYLRLLGLPLGFLINFNEPLLMCGIHRILNPRSPDLNRLQLKRKDVQPAGPVA